MFDGLFFEKCIEGLRSELLTFIRTESAWMTTILENILKCCSDALIEGSYTSVNDDENERNPTCFSLIFNREMKNRIYHHVSIFRHVHEVHVPSSMPRVMTLFLLKRLRTPLCRLYASCLCNHFLILYLLRTYFPASRTYRYNFSGPEKLPAFTGS